MPGSLTGFEKRDVVAAIRAQRARTIDVLESLSDEAWNTTVVPGWRVREVAAHLITSDEGALNGGLLRLGFRQRPIEDIEAWNETQVGRWAERPVPSLLAALDRWGRRLARILAATPGPLASRSVPTPFGKVSPLWLGMMRVYDEWVHGEDIRRALGMPSDDEPASVEPVARQLLAGLPFQTLPRISPAAAGRVTISFRDLDVPAVGIDFDERRFGSPLAGGGARVEGRAAALVMVAAGRDAWRDAETAGDLTISGDREAAETLLDALTVV